MKERRKGRDCYLCGNQGKYWKFGMFDIQKNAAEIFFIQCEWCWTTPDSEFNMRALNILKYEFQMIKE